MTETQAFSDLELDSRRNAISELVTAHNYTGLWKMGIEVVEKESAVGESCYETAFPPSIYPRDILTKVISSWEIRNSPKIGDVAIYFNTRSRSTVHLGRITENGRIRSRWGLGGMLCEHSPLDIPIYCGRELTILYFSEPK